MTHQRPVDIVAWKGYFLDINSVQAVGPVFAFSFRVCMLGGTSLLMEYASMDNVRAHRDRFVALWTTATARLGGLCSSDDIQGGHKCTE